jgi:hypothetical protein
MTDIFDRLASSEEGELNGTESFESPRAREQMLLLSCWYLFMESFRSRVESSAGSSMRNAMCTLPLWECRDWKLTSSKYR